MQDFLIKLLLLLLEVVVRLLFDSIETVVIADCSCVPAEEAVMTSVRVMLLFLIGSKLSGFCGGILKHRGK